ncbi:hypothetical protein WN51_10146 [Melipona quadrifasciata]|uniref:Uncharacterized protein n=1 Tax=Melipona quadrifasciata TaxID=166423 RepID=A0A0M9AA70_9HYME|nr:hypothetical protein WN51_10146 [Melipona quadrifasciata]
MTNFTITSLALQVNIVASNDESYSLQLQLIYRRDRRIDNVHVGRAQLVRFYPTGLTKTPEACVAAECTHDFLQKLDGIPIDPGSPCGFASLRRRRRETQFSLDGLGAQRDSIGGEERKQLDGFERMMDDVANESSHNFLTQEAERNRCSNDTTNKRFGIPNESKIKNCESKKFREITEFHQVWQFRESVSAEGIQFSLPSTTRGAVNPTPSGYGSVSIVRTWFCVDELSPDTQRRMTKEEETAKTAKEREDVGTGCLLDTRGISRLGGYKAHQEAAFRRSWLCAYNYRGFLLWYPGQSTNLEIARVGKNFPIKKFSNIERPKRKRLDLRGVKVGKKSDTQPTSTNSKIQAFYNLYELSNVVV